MKKKNWWQDVDLLVRAETGKSAEMADAPALYRAVSRAVMADISEKWQKCMESKKRRVGYLSAEFLVGRAVYANLYNLGILDEVKNALGEKQIDITEFEDVEDAALGNGGLGRLAACFLDSLSNKIPIVLSLS